MLVFGQPSAPVATALPAPAWSGITTWTLPRTDPSTPPPAPLLLAHHLLLLTTTGHGTVEIDFGRQTCRPGTLLWARPGQALRFGNQPGLDAAIVSWDRDLTVVGDAAGVDLDPPAGPSHWQLAGEDEDAIISEFAQLAFDCRRHAPGRAAAALLRCQLAVLLARTALLDDPPPAAAPDATLPRFRRLVEQQHATSRRVEDYAAQLGCSVRTLTRASLAGTGRTAKQVVDDRVALEAKRLLACTPLSVADVGRRLGFPEPTNFGRFFHREAGLSPGGFRALVGNNMPPRVPTQRPPVHAL